MNLLGNNDNNAVLSVVAAAAAVTAAAGSRANNNNLSTGSAITSNKSTRASLNYGGGVKGSGFHHLQIQSPNSVNNCANFQTTTMDFGNSNGGGGRANMNVNMVHHQQNQHHQQQQHLQAVDVVEISDLRPNSLNNILKNNIISSGNHSPGLLMVDINNNSNDLNLNDPDGLNPNHNSGCNDNVSVSILTTLSTTPILGDTPPSQGIIKAQETAIKD